MKLSHSFTIVLMVFSSSLFGQDKNHAHLFMGYEMTPGIGYRRLVNKTGDPAMDGLIKIRNDEEQILQNVSHGFRAGLNLSPHWQVSTGIRYASKGFQRDLSPKLLDTNDPALPDRIQYLRRFRFLEIPVRVTYVLYGKRDQFVLSPELYWNRFLTQKVTSYSTFPDRTVRDEYIDDGSGFDMSFVGLGFHAGVQHAFSDQLALRIAPGLRFDIIELLNDDFMSHYWNLGLEIGLYFQW